MGISIANVTNEYIVEYIYIYISISIYIYRDIHTHFLKAFHGNLTKNAELVVLREDFPGIFDRG